jgi:hypothetical protein
MDLLSRSGRKLTGSFSLDLAEAAEFIGTGHGLHGTPPIFSDRIMLFVRGWFLFRNAKFN